jgi:hypothetical protein
MEWDLGNFGLFYPERLLRTDEGRAEIEGYWKKRDVVKKAFLIVESYSGWEKAPRTLTEVGRLPWDNFVIED